MTNVIDTTAPPVMYYIGPKGDWGRAMAVPSGEELGTLFDQRAQALEMARQFYGQQGQKIGKVMTESIFCEMFRVLWVFTARALDEQQTQIDALQRRLAELETKVVSSQL